MYNNDKENNNHQGYNKVFRALITKRQYVVNALIGDFYGLNIDDTILWNFENKDWSLVSSEILDIIGSMSIQELEEADSSDKTLLIYAGQGGQTEICASIIARAPEAAHYKDSDNCTILHHLFYSYLNNPTNITQAFKVIMEANPKQLLELDTRGFTPLIEAIANGYTELAKLIIDFDPTTINIFNKKDGTPLKYAIKTQESHELIPIILENMETEGINLIGPETRISETITEVQSNAITLAARLGYAEIVKSLLKKGAHADKLNIEEIVLANNDNPSSVDVNNQNRCIELYKAAKSADEIYFNNDPSFIPNKMDDELYETICARLKLNIEQDSAPQSKEDIVKKIEPISQELLSKVMDLFNGSEKLFENLTIEEAICQLEGISPAPLSTLVSSTIKFRNPNFESDQEKNNYFNFYSELYPEKILDLNKLKDGGLTKEEVNNLLNYLHRNPVSKRYFEKMDVNELYTCLVKPEISEEFKLQIKKIADSAILPAATKTKLKLALANKVIYNDELQANIKSEAIPLLINFHNEEEDEGIGLSSEFEEESSIVGDIGTDAII